MKITAELDTETKECFLYIDGQIVDSQEFTIGQYRYMKDNGLYTISKWVSVTTQVTDDITLTKNINIRDDKVEIAETTDNVSRKLGQAKAKLDSILALANIFNRNKK